MNYRAQYHNQPEHIKGLCQKYMNYHVMGQLTDGSQFEGIIDDMDQDGVTMLVPEEMDSTQLPRQYGYDDDYDGYGRPRRKRFRRFRRRRFPYRDLLSLLLYPYYAPYPPYPPYGYPYGYYDGY